MPNIGRYRAAFGSSDSSGLLSALTVDGAPRLVTRLCLARHALALLARPDGRETARRRRNRPLSSPADIIVSRGENRDENSLVGTGIDPSCLCADFEQVRGSDQIQDSRHADGDHQSGNDSSLGPRNIP